jgi:hypothetical protein
MNRPPQCDASLLAASPTTGRPGDSARRWLFTTATVVLIGLGLLLVLSIGAFLVSISLPALLQARKHAQEQAAQALHAEATLVQEFTTADSPIADYLTVSDNGWSLDSQNAVGRNATQSVRLFEVHEFQGTPRALFYQADLKSENLNGRAYLEMWCRIPGRGEFFSRGLNDALSGTTDWISSQTPFLLPPDETVELVRLNLVVEGTGRVWIRNVKLLARH